MKLKQENVFKLKQLSGLMIEKRKTDVLREERSEKRWILHLYKKKRLNKTK